MRASTRDLVLGALVGFAAPAAALVVVLERHNRELRRLTRRLAILSGTDALTGVPNRRTFDERLAEEVARANRYGTRLALVMVDLDRFKGLNDRHGHPAGDEALRRVAAVLEREKRLGDLVARVGGEEFAALLPHTDTRAAAAWAERARRAVAATSIPVPGAALTLTASFGVAEASVGVERPERLVQAADAALYAAKRLGRNRVVSAGDERAHPLPGS